ncbi:MAG: hypothetical protein LC107_11445 [Chitinophagales bacterium]|nr:hypothetical protein [Chitinophagales bacterium]
MIFNKTNSRYIAGGEIDFNNPDMLKKILLTQGIDKNGFDFFEAVQTATEIFIENNSIIKVDYHSESEKESENIQARLPITDWIDRALFFLTKDQDGNHKICGDCPPGFKLPYHDNLKTPFIFMGSIDTTDQRFDWINLPRLDIAYPIYEFNAGIFLDYSNPQNPEIINPDTFEDYWFFDSLKGLGKVKFKEQKYSVKTQIDLNNFVKNEDNILLCGVPLWYQGPDIPTCPKTGEVMRFVCTINSDSSICIVDENGIENKREYLSFGDYGHLFVFFHPDSKVMHLNIQY